MVIVYDIDPISIDNQAIADNLQRICGQTFKLLPLREEEQDWQKPLETLIIELLGMSSLFNNQKDLLTLVCKLEGLLVGGEEIDFFLYRRTIFECCTLIAKIKENFIKE